MKKNTVVLIGLALLESAFGASIIVLGKLVLTEIPQFTYIFLRFLLGSLAILPFYLKQRPKVDKGIIKVILLSLLSTVNVLTFVLGIKYTTANAAGLLFSIMPITVAILSIFIIKERPTLLKSVGITLGFLGAIIPAIVHAKSEGLDIWQGIIGDAIILIGVVSFSFYSVISKKFHEKYSSTELTSWFVFTTAFVFIIPTIRDQTDHWNWWTGVSPKIVFAMITVGIIGTAIYYILYQYLIKKASPTIAAMTQYLQPFAVFIQSYILLGEKSNSLLVAGSVVALVGVWLATNGKKRK